VFDLVKIIAVFRPIGVTLHTNQGFYSLARKSTL